jgi:hypothetical protein
MDRRIGFCLVAALTCALLTPLAPADFRWVPMVVCGVYLVLAALTALERWTEDRRRREPRP